LGEPRIMSFNKLLKHLLEHPKSLQDAYSALSTSNNGLPGKWERVVLGKSGEGNPIVAYERRAGSEDPKILVIAGQHGNEPAGMAACYALILLDSLYREVLPPRFWGFRETHVNLYVVPVANPDGLYNYLQCIEKDSMPYWYNTCPNARYNSRSTDINRDWLYLTQPETRALHSYVSRIEPDIVLDLHEFYASKGSPPKWSIETEGFDTTLTDAPYAMVDEKVSLISTKTMNYIVSILERIMGRKIRERHFTGSDKPYPPPDILGAHLPLEYYPKILVETWGVGLHGFLWRERVLTHLIAILSTVEYLDMHREQIYDLREHIHGLNSIDPDYLYIVDCGDLCGDISSFLNIHGVNHDLNGNEIRVYPRGRSRIIADLLFDPMHPYNVVLEKNGYGRRTLDLLYPCVCFKKQSL